MQEFKILRNAPFLPDEQGRKRWPFADMRVNDVLEVKNRADWPVTSKAAHSFAVEQKPRWKFQTKWLKTSKVGRIRRLA